MPHTEVFSVLFLQSSQSTSLYSVFTKHLVFGCLRIVNEGGKIQEDMALAGIQSVDGCVRVQAKPSEVLFKVQDNDRFMKLGVTQNVSSLTP